MGMKTTIREFFHWLSFKRMGYHLEDAEERHRNCSLSFDIPPKVVREDMAVGQIAKLIFIDNLHGGSERMRVEIGGRRKDQYVGTLIDSAIAVRSRDGHVLSHGKEIVFLAKNICDTR